MVTLKSRLCGIERGLKSAFNEVLISKFCESGKFIKIDLFILRSFRFMKNIEIFKIKIGNAKNWWLH